MYLEISNFVGLKHEYNESIPKRRIPTRRNAELCIGIIKRPTYSNNLGTKALKE